MALSGESKEVEDVVEPVLDSQTREDMIRRAWYVHDARWFAAVAAEFGMEAANRLNRSCVRAVGEVEAARLARALGMEGGGEMDTFLTLLKTGLDLYVGSSMIDMDIRKVDERRYEVAVAECFVAKNIERAGIAEVYQCAVWDRVRGYHAALGQTLSDDQLPPMLCLKARGRECRREFRID